MKLTSSNILNHKDYRLNYRVKGAGKKDIIFLHGFGLSSYTWNSIENKFNLDKFRLILIDLKGSGFSQRKLNSDYSVAAQVEIIEKLILHLRVKKFDLIAHSYGGIVALCILNCETKRHVKKVILIDTPAFNNFKPFFIKALRNPILSFIGLKVLSSKYLAKKIIRKTFFNYELGLRNFLKLYTFFYSMKGNDYTMVRMAEQIIPNNIDEVIDNYKNILNEVLIIWGEKDDLIDQSQGERLLKNLTNGQMSIIKDCGHVPQEEKPDEVFEFINTFLTKL